MLRLQARSSSLVRRVSPAFRASARSFSADDDSHDDFKPKRKAVPDSMAEVHKLIEDQVKENPVMLYMKGDNNDYNHDYNHDYNRDYNRDYNHDSKTSCKSCLASFATITVYESALIGSHSCMRILALHRQSTNEYISTLPTVSY
jgi:hypothetical protein